MGVLRYSLDGLGRYVLRRTVAIESARGALRSRVRDTVDLGGRRAGRGLDRRLHHFMIPGGPITMSSLEAT